MAAVEVHALDVGGRAARGLHRVVDLLELGVGAAGHQRDRHAQLGQPVPQRILSARTEVSKGRGQLCSRVARSPVGQTGRVRIQRREERLREPVAQERVDTSRLDIAREPFVRLTARRALRRIRDTGRRAHECKSLHQVGTIEREAQAQTTAHRVADVRAPSAGRSDRGRGRVEVEPDGNVERSRVVPSGAQASGHRVPGRRGLREAGYEHHARHSRILTGRAG